MHDRERMKASLRCLIATALIAAPILGAVRASAEGTLRLTGVNIAGAEFGHNKMPGRHGTDYFYPSRTTIDYFVSKGLTTLRVPFRWERLQPALGGGLDQAELKLLDDLVSYATSKGANVILDVHNYAAYNKMPIGAPEVSPGALADLWKRIAERYGKNDKIIFGLMNEPKGLPTETWLTAANAAIAAIRGTGARNLILVPGNGWTGAHSWLSRGYGTPNAEVMLGVIDSANNFAYEAHQYLDADFSGTKPQCRNEQIGVKALTAFTNWLKQHGKRGFLGEFGGGSDPVCLAALDGMLEFMAQNRDVWLGWTYWAAGPWPNNYFTSVQPNGGVDRPQMLVLLKHVAP
jgi:endoglucanase